MKKKIVVVAIILALFILSLFVIYKVLTHTEIDRKVVISDITFSDAKVYKKDSNYYVDVNITVKEKTNLSSIDVIVYDKKGELIDTLNTKVGEIDKSLKVSAKTNINLSKAYSINYVVNRE